MPEPTHLRRVAKRGTDCARRFHHVNGVFLDLLALDARVGSGHADGADQFTGSPDDSTCASRDALVPFAMQHVGVALRPRCRDVLAELLGRTVVKIA